MANMVRWDPARDMVSLREAMDRLFEESFLSPRLFGNGDSVTGNLPLDIYETRDRIVVKAAVPGVKPEDIEVTVTGDLLTIKGEFKSESENRDEERNYVRQERRLGSFARQVTLPVAVNVENCQADFENGILTLEMPKVEAAKARTVKVNAK